MTVPALPVVTPITQPNSSRVDFGATVTNLALSTPLSDAAFAVVEQALYKYKVIVFPDAASQITPDLQFALVKRFDPDAYEHGHNDATASHKGQKSLLHGIGNSIQSHPEIKLVGGGVQGEIGGNKNLEQAGHWAYHRFPLTEEERLEGKTRWHRWHMDAALFKTDLPLVTTLLAVAVPQGPDLTVQWDDGSGNTMKVAPGTTGFISGSKMFNLLSEEDKLMCENSTVAYAPYPYQWGGPSKGNSNGLGTYNEGKEMAFEDLPPWDEKDLKVYPLVWTNPVTGEKSLQVHSVAVWKLHLKSSPDAPVTTVDDLAEVRKILYKLQRPAVEPHYIFAPPYKKGDLVMFYNRGVYHSATDYPESYGTRTMLQAHVACSYPPS
ncbi:Clavaminate synthase-like protein [Meredithblackwellia eburnea MCA 4105]